MALPTSVLWRAQRKGGARGVWRGRPRHTPRGLHRPPGLHLPPSRRAGEVSFGWGVAHSRGYNLREPPHLMVLVCVGAHTQARWPSLPTCAPKRGAGSRGGWEGTDRLLTRPKGAHTRPLTSHRLIPWVVIVTTLPTAQKHKVRPRPSDSADVIPAARSAARNCHGGRVLVNERGGSPPVDSTFASGARRGQYHGSEMRAQLPTDTRAYVA